MAPQRRKQKRYMIMIWTAAVVIAWIAYEVRKANRAMQQADAEEVRMLCEEMVEMGMAELLEYDADMVAALELIHEVDED